MIKKRKLVPTKRGGLSFDNDEDEANDNETKGKASKSGKLASLNSSNPATDSEDVSDAAPSAVFKKRALGPNTAVGLQPKALTKSALLKESQLKEALKKEYVQIQEAVKATEFMLPFVFYDGKSVPGGACRMKKGDFIWLFLDRARKLGADLAGRGDHSKRDWARISVDDLMVVKGDIIIPHVSKHLVNVRSEVSVD